VEIYRDGINADRYASDYEKVIRKVTASDELTIDMKPGGGWVARFYK
jgi:alpha-glucosidase